MEARLLAIACALPVLAPVMVLAQGGPRGDAQNYPVRPIRFLIPYSPGGASDNIGRILMPRVSEGLKQTIVIDNRPGGAGNWFGVMGPPKLPRAIVERINAEIHRALRHPEVVERFTVSSIEALPTTPEEFQKHIESEYARWGRVIRAAGIKPE